MLKTRGDVLIGARIPASLKGQLINYCRSCGIKMSYFVSEAIRDRLLEMAEDKHDVATAKARLKTANFISLKELEKYLRDRGIAS